MSTLINNTPFAAAQNVAIGVDGRERLVVAVKATFAWTRGGDVGVAAAQVPVCACDEFDGDPAESGLSTAAELTLPKPKVDVLVSGDIALATAVDQIDVTLQVGERIHKTIRVSGDRVWVPGYVHTLVPCRPVPFSHMPIQWQRSFGGVDPGTDAIELRNPVGCGVRKRPSDLAEKPVPNFEDPRTPLARGGDRAEPVGFGAIAPHWKPRVEHAGTYDAAWQKERFPLLPVDFDARFLNVAPMDQQLDMYEPGEQVHLTHMSPAGRDSFRLPQLGVPVTVVDRGRMVELVAQVDTVIIRPAEAQLCVLARAVHLPERSMADVAAVYAGELSPGQRRALETGKMHVRWS